jgi:glycosyltransferase involved in cell wall biosynthesis
MTIFAERTQAPFTDVPARFWEQGAGKAARARLIAESTPSLAVVHQHLPTAVELSRRLKGTPVALVRHNFVKPPGGPFARWRRRRQFRRLAGLGFVSECCRAAFRSDWPDVALSLFVTPNGIDTASWQPAAVKRRRIVFTGRLTPEKGVLEAVRAIGAVLSRHPDWEAVLTLATAPRTDGYDTAVQAAIAETGGRVTVLENLPHPEIRPIVAEASIAIAPTQTAEPFGRVAIEALASGTVLIATGRGGFVEVVGDAGVLIEPPSAEAIADALDGLIADPARRARLAALGRARILGRYDLASAAAAFDSMIDELMPPLSMGGAAVPLTSVARPRTAKALPS